MCIEYLLNPTSYRLVSAVYYALPRRLGIKELAARSGVSVGATGKYVKILVNLGILEVRREGRKKVVNITDKGFKYLALMVNVENLCKK